MRMLKSLKGQVNHVRAALDGRRVLRIRRGTSWLKIKNPDYSQMEGRHELFEVKRLVEWAPAAAGR